MEGRTKAKAGARAWGGKVIISKGLVRRKRVMSRGMGMERELAAAINGRRDRQPLTSSSAARLALLLRSFAGLAVCTKAESAMNIVK